MRTSATTAKIDATMAKLQAEIAPLVAAGKVQVDGPKGKWDSKFVTLAQMMDVVGPLLDKYGIALYFYAELQGQSERWITRMVAHGEWVESESPLKVSRDGPQGVGAGISFGKRWGISALCRITMADAADERQGYNDTRAPKRSAAPVGLAAFVARIAAAGNDQIVAVAAEARAANPTGDGSAAVEQAISKWAIYALDGASSVEDLDATRDACTRARPRSASEVREAVRRNALRLGAP